MLNEDNTTGRTTPEIPNDPRPYRPEYHPNPVTPDDAGREAVREEGEAYAESGRGIPAWDEAQAILQGEERDRLEHPVERELPTDADRAPDVTPEDDRP